MKIVFFGSDAFSIKSLEACLHSGMELAAVITTSAKKKGRGLHLESSEIFNYCQAKGLPVAEYASLRDPRSEQTLIALQPDIFVVASYGKLIPPNLLQIPKYRLNVHPSLLPKYRGSAPVQWAVLNGDAETGVSIIDIAEKLDAGDIFCQEKLPIGPRVSTDQLMSELARFSYGILKKVLAQIREGKLQGIPQDEAAATLAPQLTKQDGAVSLETMTAEEIDRKVRGLQPWPGAHCFHGKERIVLLKTDLADQDAVERPGTFISAEKDGGIGIATRKGILKILKVKPEGKKEMSAADFARGRRLDVGATLFL